VSSLIDKLKKQLEKEVEERMKLIAKGARGNKDYSRGAIEGFKGNIKGVEA